MLDIPYADVPIKKKDIPCTV